MTQKTLFGALLLVLLMSSCGKTYQIAFQVEEGMKHRYVSENTTTAETKVMGMDVENVTINNITYSLESLGKTTSGNERLNMVYEDIQYEQRTMGQEVIFDSQDPSRTNNPQMEQIYAGLLGSDIELIYSPKGQLIESIGLAEVMDEMFKDLPEEAQTAMASQFGDDAILQALKSMTHYYPQQEKVKPGDSWTVTNELGIGGMELVIDSRFTLIEVKDGQAKIQLSSEIDSNPEAEGLQMMGMNMKFDLQGTQEGFLYVDEQTSWLERMEVDQQLDGIMKMDSEQTGPMDIDMNIKTIQLIRKAD